MIRPPGSAATAALRRLVATFAGLLLAAAVAGLGGCGPGLGGTGTGATDDALAAQGAREVPVCDASFASFLGCASPSPGTGAAPLPAAGPRFFAEATPASRHLLELDGQDAQLRLRCLDSIFIGTFGQVGSAEPRYYGNTIEGGSRIRLSTLLVRPVALGLEVTLVDSLGVTLAGPVVLAPVAGATSAAAC